jgi:uncharacterized protein
MTTIESPCNKVCAVDPAAALCVGCGRTLAEIEGWIRFTADERARIAALALGDAARVEVS